MDRLSPLKRDLLKRKLARSARGRRLGRVAACASSSSAAGAFAIPSSRRCSTPATRCAALVTQPDREKGRGRALAPPPLKPVAEAPRRPRAAAAAHPRARGAARRCARSRPRSRSWWPTARSCPRAVHRHRAAGHRQRPRSLLPRYRGAAPIQWAIADGDAETGVTTMLIDEGLDTGPSCSRARTADRPGGDGGRARAAPGRAGRASCSSRRCAASRRARSRPTPQDHAQATLAPHPQEGRRPVDWTRPGRGDRLPRARLPSLARRLRPRFEGRALKVLRARAEPRARRGAGRAPCWPSTRDGVVVACGDGTRLRLLEVQPESRRAMPAAAFAQGARLGPARGSAERAHPGPRALALPDPARARSGAAPPSRSARPAATPRPRRPRERALPPRAGARHAAPSRAARSRPRAPRRPAARELDPPVLDGPAPGRPPDPPPARARPRGGVGVGGAGARGRAPRRPASSTPSCGGWPARARRPQPDPAPDPIGLADQRGSLPRWLAERWLAPPRAGRGAWRARAALLEPPPDRRSASTRASATRRARLEAAGVELAARGSCPERSRRDRAADSAASPRRASLYLQDEGSQLVAHLAAGPGLRARRLRRARRQGPADGRPRGADGTGGRGRGLAAAARDAGRPARALGRAERAPRGRRRPPPALRAGASTRVLLDAPCSGLGTLGRHPDIRWRARARRPRRARPSGSARCSRAWRPSSRRAAGSSTRPARSSPRRPRGRRRPVPGRAPRVRARAPARWARPFADGRLRAHARPSATGATPSSPRGSAAG